MRTFFDTLCHPAALPQEPYTNCMGLLSTVMITHRVFLQLAAGPAASLLWTLGFFNWLMTFDTLANALLYIIFLYFLQRNIK